MENINEIKDTINDCYVNMKGDTPTQKQIVSILNNLPQNIQYDIKEWGVNDTVAKDNICEFIAEYY